MQAVKITHSLVIISPPDSREALALIVGEMSEMANVAIDSISFSPMTDDDNGPLSINLNFLTDDDKSKFEAHTGAKKHFARAMLSKCDCPNCKEQLTNLDAIFDRFERAERGEGWDGFAPAGEDSIVMGAPSTLQ